MTEPSALWRFLLERLERKIPAGLMAVVASRGSSPGKAGAKMAVGADGALLGTVGGGLVERQLVEDMRARLACGGDMPVLVRKIHHRADKDASGMICGGEQTVLLRPCLEKDRAPLVELCRALEMGIGGELTLEPAGLRFEVGEVSAEAEFGFEHDEDGHWRYRERIGLRDTVYLVGGGHVSLALSQILVLLDFRVVVLDERPDLASFVENTHAHQKISAPFAEAYHHIPEGDHHYVAVMTPSDASDGQALRGLAGKRLRYLGLLGSHAKVSAVLGRLAGQLPSGCWAQIHAPMGLPIHSHTPPEIAVSIAAEMVRVRNESP